MSVANKFLSAVIIFSLSCVAIFSVGNAVAQELRGANSHEMNSKLLAYAYPPTPIQISVQLESNQAPRNAYLPVLVAQNNEYIPKKSLIKSNNSGLFRFFTKFNDNLQMVFSWFTKVPDSVEKKVAMKEIKTCG